MYVLPVFLLWSLVLCPKYFGSHQAQKELANFRVPIFFFFSLKSFSILFQLYFQHFVYTTNISALVFIWQPEGTHICFNQYTCPHVDIKSYASSQFSWMGKIALIVWELPKDFRALSAGAGHAKSLNKLLLLPVCCLLGQFERKDVFCFFFFF